MMHAIILIAMKKLLSDTRGEECEGSVTLPLDRGIRVVKVAACGTAAVGAAVAGANGAAKMQDKTAADIAQVTGAQTAAAPQTTAPLH